MKVLPLTGPELGALLPESTSDHVVAAFGSYRLTDKIVREVGSVALAARAASSAATAALLPPIRHELERAVGASESAVRVIDMDEQASFQAVVALDWGSVQVAILERGWYMVQTDVALPNRGVEGLVQPLSTAPTVLVERFASRAYECLGHSQGRTGRFDQPSQGWEHVANEDWPAFKVRLTSWLS